MEHILFYILIIFCAVMSIAAFAAMGIDKSKARAHVRRIPEKTLFRLAIFGGGVGGTLGMYLFHHKTKHWYFALFFPLLALLQLGACGYVYYLNFIV